MHITLNFFLIAVLLRNYEFAPTASNTYERNPTLLISVDGFRADKLEEFLKEHPDSILKKYFVDGGVKAEYMVPSFPSLTFPNHFTLVTGLYMESHGIVGNKVFDSDLNQKVNFLDNTDSSRFDVKWWNKTSPIWLEAKNQGLKTASFFWTGSEVWQRHPDIFLKYNDKYEYSYRSEIVVNWFKKYKVDFGTLYFNEPDSSGHSKGPDSNEYKQAILSVDKAIGRLIERLTQELLIDNINLIIVSDHGMALMEKSNTILAKDYYNVSLIDTDKSLYGIVSQLYPKNDSDIPLIYNSLKSAGNLTVYLQEEFPEKFHLKKSNRIAPIIVISNEGYVFHTQRQTNVGNHGFDNELESMRAIFLARGPDFKSNSRMGPLKNVDVYPLVCSLLQITCHQNNGTIDSFPEILNQNARNYMLHELRFY